MLSRIRWKLHQAKGANPKRWFTQAKQDIPVATWCLKDRCLKTDSMYAKTRREYRRMVKEYKAIARAQDRMAREAKAWPVLLANTVVTRLRGFTVQDAFDPAKIAAAFVKTPPKYYAYVHRRRAYNRPLHLYKPSNGKRSVNRSRTNWWRKSRTKRGYPQAYAVNLSGSGSTDLAVFYYKREEPRDLPLGTPGLVWAKLSKDKVIFVTMDGGRYVSTIRGIMLGHARTKLWPKAPIHPIVLMRDVVWLGNAKLLPAKYGQRMLAAEKANIRCVKRIQRSYRRAYERINAANIFRRVRNARIARLERTITRVAKKRCGKHFRRYRAAWNRAQKLWMKRRMSVFTKVHTHMLSQWGPRKKALK